MKALVLREYNNLVYEDFPAPVPGPDEVLINVKACAICGSDVHGLDGSTNRRKPPIIMGHEASGVIVGTGCEVTHFSIGDRVTFDSTVYCSSCHYCKDGMTNLCDDRRVLGVSCDEYKIDGAFAEYIAVPARILYKLPDNVTFEQAAMTEPLSVAFHAVRLSGVQTCETALVVGAGTIGLMTVGVLKALGVKTVILTDLDRSRLELGRIMGAGITIDSSVSSVQHELESITQGVGADLSFEAVGVNSALKDAVYPLKKGGRCVLIGNVSPTVNIPLQWIVTRQISLLGSCTAANEYPGSLSLIASGRINVDRLISASAPLSEGAAWFSKLYSKEQGLLKVVLNP